MSAVAIGAAAQRVERWLHAPAPPERLAALRIAVAGFVTLYLVANAGEFARLADRDTAAFEPVGLANALSGPLSGAATWAFFGVLVFSGVAFTAGIAARVIGPIFAVLVLGWTSYHSSFGQLLHFEHLFTLHLLILAMAPSADAWAVRRRSTPTPSLEPSVRYGWPIRLLALTTATTYVLSGIAKLRLTGFAWFDPDTLSAHIGYSTTRMETIGGRTPPLARAVLARPWLIAPMAVAALLVELGAPLALVSHRARNVWVGAALAFHAGTAMTMLVFFGYRGLGFAMLPLFAVERIVSLKRQL